METFEELNSHALGEIAVIIAPYTSRHCVTTVEGVRWLLDSHIAKEKALSLLEKIRTDAIATDGHPDAASIISLARVTLRAKSNHTP